MGSLEIILNPQVFLSAVKMSVNQNMNIYIDPEHRKLLEDK